MSQPSRTHTIASKKMLQGSMLQIFGNDQQIIVTVASESKQYWTTAVIVRSDWLAGEASIYATGQGVIKVYSSPSLITILAEDHSGAIIDVANISR